MDSDRANGHRAVGQVIEIAGCARPIADHAARAQSFEQIAHIVTSLGRFPCQPRNDIKENQCLGVGDGDGGCVVGGDGGEVA